MNVCFKTFMMLYFVRKLHMLENILFLFQNQHYFGNFQSYDRMIYIRSNLLQTKSIDVRTTNGKHAGKHVTSSRSYKFG